jgi:type 1 glutamine amidotransferase
VQKALIVSGGWDGHQPTAIAELFTGWLQGDGFEVENTTSLDRLTSGLSEFDLIVPNWTMGQISGEQSQALCDAVAAGAGLAGVHGGMGDAFRENTEYQFMVGGQFVAHPGNAVAYTVSPCSDHEIVAGVAPFSLTSEQYFLHVDPGNQVLATTPFPNAAAPGPHSANPCQMPQCWVRNWGAGRVFYLAIGHDPAELTAPGPETIIRRGFNWAAR